MPTRPTSKRKSRTASAKAPSNGSARPARLPGWAWPCGPPCRRGPRPRPPPEAQDIAAEAVERTGLLPADLAWLDHPAYQWKHLQTEHFVLHHDQKMFAAKVARMGEQFYDAISADLPDLRDRISPARSHIFIFRDPRDWQAVVAGRRAWKPGPPRSCAATSCICRKPAPPPSDKMDTLAHEMTHLVFNRFLPVRLPLWLNEGLAEYYGEFAYRAAQGHGTKQRQRLPSR